MNQSFANLEVKVLEKMYLRETKILKYKMLNAVFKKSIVRQENKVMELAQAIHAKQSDEVTIQDKFLAGQF